MGVIPILRADPEKENDFFLMGWGGNSKKVARIFWLFGTAYRTQQPHNTATAPRYVSHTADPIQLTATTTATADPVRIVNSQQPRNCVLEDTTKNLVKPRHTRVCVPPIKIYLYKLQNQALGKPRKHWENENKLKKSEIILVGIKEMN